MCAISDSGRYGTISWDMNKTLFLAITTTFPKKPYKGKEFASKSKTLFRETVLEINNLPPGEAFGRSAGAFAGGCRNAFRRGECGVAAGGKGWEISRSAPLFCCGFVENCVHLPGNTHGRRLWLDTTIWEGTGRTRWLATCGSGVLSFWSGIGGPGERPEELLDWRKRRNLLAAGAAFLASRGLDRELRFDLVVVSGPERRIDYYPEIIDLF